MTRNNKLSRRNVLTTIGAASLPMSIAGCVGDDESDDSSDGADGSDSTDGTATPDYDVDQDAPARLELLAVDFPDDITYGETFEGEITVANTGGETLEQTASISLELLSSGDMDAQTAEINSEGLESGEELSHTIGQFTAQAAGDYRIQASDEFYAVDDTIPETISVTPLEAQMGEQVETPIGLRYTVEDVSYEQTLLNKNVEESSLGDDEVTIKERSTLDDRIITVVDVTAENPTGDGKTVSPDTLSITEGNAISGINPVTIDEPEIRGQQVNPGDSEQGWLAAAVDIESLGSLQLGIHVTANDSPADIAVNLGDEPNLPEFELVDASHPQERQPGSEEFTFEIENTGEGVGTFRGAVEYLFENEEELGLSVGSEAGKWYYWNIAMTAVIPPGETRTVSFTSGSKLTITYRIQPMEYEFTVQKS